ncbi:MAG TPA: beta-1-3, beta-1-6-glucan biosynthesis protein, partial [Xanthobacteraceae bacterium]|nr:beta-1-3, beta-1-6-glucan biosynthesis protein [Xanthobacteraceae bacterium]
LLGGPAANPECLWLGRRVVSLLWRDDLDTAFRHLDLYDRFGCPAGHIQATFRCLVRQGNIDPKATDTLNSRVHGCWVDPNAEAQGTAAVPSGTTNR